MARERERERVRGVACVAVRVCSGVRGAGGRGFRAAAGEGDRGESAGDRDVTAWAVSGMGLKTG